MGCTTPRVAPHRSCGTRRPGSRGSDRRAWSNRPMCVGRWSRRSPDRVDHTVAYVANNRAGTMNSRCQRRALRTNSRAPATDSPRPPARQSRPATVLGSQPDLQRVGNPDPDPDRYREETVRKSHSSLPRHGPTPKHCQHHERHDAGNEDPRQLPYRCAVTADDEHHAETDATHGRDAPNGYQASPGSRFDAAGLLRIVPVRRTRPSGWWVPT